MALAKKDTGRRNHPGKKRHRKKKPASNSDVTPESTPEKQKGKHWRKSRMNLRSPEASNKKSNRQKPKKSKNRSYLSLSINTAAARFPKSTYRCFQSCRGTS
jgi:hypothetical protein